MPKCFSFRMVEKEIRFREMSILERIHDGKARRPRIMFHRRPQRTHHPPKVISTVLKGALSSVRSLEVPLLQSRNNLAITELVSM